MVQENSINNKILIICGPTASGKTALSVGCAHLFDTEIISADSMNIYKGLDIGTAKPTEREMEGVKHHLIDVVSPKEEFSVSDYRRLARPIVDELLSRGKVPIICGGTGFYINSLLYDLSYGNAVGSEKIRDKYEKMLEDKGADYLFSVLEELDPETAALLHKNDVKRVIRAIEIYEVSGRKKSSYSDEMKPRYDYTAVSIAYPRQELYERINKRVDLMLESGLREEVARLKDEYALCIGDQSMQAIGYKEIFSENITKQDEITSDIIKRNTRKYAKRQETFFKKLPNLVYLAANDAKYNANIAYNLFYNIKEN